MQVASVADCIQSERIAVSRPNTTVAIAEGLFAKHHVGSAAVLKHAALFSARGHFLSDCFYCVFFCFGCSGFCGPLHLSAFQVC